MIICIVTKQKMSEAEKTKTAYEELGVVLGKRRKSHHAIIGDMYASRSAQKGICGLLFPENEEQEAITVEKPQSNTGKT